MDQPPTLLSLRTAFTALGLLAGCALALGLYAACAVLAGTTEAVAAAVALGAQGLWQTLLVRALHGARRSTPAVQAAVALAGYGLGGVLGLEGASAFFSVAAVALVPMPAAGAGSAWWTATRRPAPAADGVSAGGGS